MRAGRIMPGFERGVVDELSPVDVCIFHSKKADEV